MKTGRILAAALAGVLCMSGALLAQGSTQPDGLDEPLGRAADIQLAPQTSPDSVDAKLAESFARPAGILPYGPVSLLDPLVKKANAELDKVGLKVGFAYTAAYQYATGGPNQRDAASEDFDLFGNWRLLGPKDSDYNGYLYYYAEYRNDLGTGISPSALGGQVGSLWSTTNGFSEQPVTLKELYWQQHFAKDKLIVRIGKLDPENYYNSNYWQSDAKFFMNAAFSSFPVRAFPGQGLGMNITAKPLDDWYISTGFQDAQGKKTESGFDTFFNDFNMFGAFELGYTPNIANLGQGTYRATAWYRDAGERNGKPHDGGLDLSIDQHVSTHLIPFFRYGWGEGNINGIEQMISGGAGWEGNLINNADAIGLGAAWGRPANHDLRDQTVLELFYRLQVSPDNQWTVGYQVIFNPSNQPKDDVVGVLEIRWRITL